MILNSLIILFVALFWNWVQRVSSFCYSYLCSYPGWFFVMYYSILYFILFLSFHGKFIYYVSCAFRMALYVVLKVRWMFWIVGNDHTSTGSISVYSILQLVIISKNIWIETMFGCVQIKQSFVKYMFRCVFICCLLYTSRCV